MWTGPSPVVLPNPTRSRLLRRLKELVREIERLDEVVKVTVFRAIVEPPTACFSSYLKERGPSLRLANFDVMVLIETTSPATARGVLATSASAALLDAIRSETDTVYSLAARNRKRIADVDTARPGLFLFNHFAADPDVMLQLWDHLAGWYVVETGLNDSVGLVPLDREASDYAIVSWARWDENPLRHFWRQLSKKSLRTFVTANLDANRAGSMPIYCRLA